MANDHFKRPLLIVLIGSFMLGLMMRLFRLYIKRYGSLRDQNLRVFCHFHIVVDFGNSEKKVQNIRGLKMVVF